MVLPMGHFHLEIMWSLTAVLRPKETKTIGTANWLVPPAMRAVPMVATCLVSLMQERAQREEFRFKHLLQRAQELRVEQLQREKARAQLTVTNGHAPRPMATYTALYCH